MWSSSSDDDVQLAFLQMASAHYEKHLWENGVKLVRWKDSVSGQVYLSGFGCRLHVAYFSSFACAPLPRRTLRGNAFVMMDFYV